MAILGSSPDQGSRKSSGEPFLPIIVFKCANFGFNTIHLAQKIEKKPTFSRKSLRWNFYFISIILLLSKKDEIWIAHLKFCHMIRLSNNYVNWKVYSRGKYTILCGEYEVLVPANSQNLVKISSFLRPFFAFLRFIQF